MVVADASSLVDFLIRRRSVGDWVGHHLAEAGIVHCPHLVDVEVVSALRRLVRHGRLEPEVAGRALYLFSALRIQRYAITVLLDRLWSLREHVSAYDASYIALAESLGLPLLTTDSSLARSHGHDVQIVAYPG